MKHWRDIICFIFSKMFPQPLQCHCNLVFLFFDITKINLAVFLGRKNWFDTRFFLVGHESIWNKKKTQFLRYVWGLPPPPWYLTVMTEYDIIYLQPVKREAPCVEYCFFLRWNPVWNWQAHEYGKPQNENIPEKKFNWVEISFTLWTWDFLEPIPHRFLSLSIWPAYG